MSTRAALAAAFAAAFAACGVQDEEPACCAIEPKARCESALHALGVTEAEKEALIARPYACPSETLTIERIRELDSQWPQACRQSGVGSPRIDLERCARDGAR